jgi:hypothetical protein
LTNIGCRCARLLFKHAGLRLGLSAQAIQSFQVSRRFASVSGCPVRERATKASRAWSMKPNALTGVPADVSVYFSALEAPPSSLMPVWSAVFLECGEEIGTGNELGLRGTRHLQESRSETLRRQHRSDWRSGDFQADPQRSTGVSGPGAIVKSTLLQAVVSVHDSCEAASQMTVKWPEGTTAEQQSSGCMAVWSVDNLTRRTSSL